ncbi:glycosyltransferase family 2 protein [Vibrio harveyi]|nr:glycosyltransferase family 2 protein [Vibrio harveyi]
MNTKFSIIVCAYNEKENIENCLQSIFDIYYSHDDFEVIVCDNSSSDGTFELANKKVTSHLEYDVTLLRIEHVDLSTSRNTALNIAKYEHVIFFDADAIVDKNILQEYNKVILRDPDVDILSGKVINIENSTIISDYMYRTHFRASIDNISNSKLIGANMLFKKSLLNDTKFLKGMKRGDESSLLVRLKRKKPSLREMHVDNAVVANEFPLTLKQWVRVVHTEGMMRYIIDSKVLRESSGKTLAKVTFRLLTLCFLIKATISMDYFSVSFLVVLLIVRFRSLSGYLKSAFKNSLESRFGSLGFFCVPFSCLLLTLSRDVGYIVGCLNSSLHPVRLTQELSVIKDKIVFKEKKS